MPLRVAVWVVGKGGSLTFTAGSTDAQRIRLEPFDDRIAEGNETFTIAFSGGGTFSWVTLPATAPTITIVDNDTAGVMVDPTSLGVLEGRTESYEVVLQSRPTGNVVVTPMSGDGSAMVSGPLTFTTANWDDPQEVMVTGVEDDIDNFGNQRGSAIITHSVTGGGYDGIAPSAVTVTVTDNDTAAVAVSTAALTVDENSGTMDYTVVLRTEPTSDVTITITNSASGNVSLSTTSLTFTSMNWNTAQPVTVTGVNDDIDNPSDQRMATISHTASGGGYDSVSIGSVAVTVTDDDTDNVEVTPTTLSLREDSQTGTYNVRLATQPSGNVTIAISNSAPGNATVSETSLTFTTANWNTAQPVTVTTVNDDIDNPSDRTTTITHAVTGYGSVATASSVTVTVRDDDAAGVDISQPTITINEDGGTATYEIVLNSRPTGNVVVTLTNDAVGTATVSEMSLTFTTANWDTAQTVTVTAINDDIDNMGNRTATITHAVTGYGTITTAMSVTVTVVDDDSAGVRISENSLEVEENAGTATYTLRLNTRPTGDVTVTPTSSDTSATVSGALTFTTANWNQTQTVTVTGVNDDIDNTPDRTATISHPVSGGGYDSITVGEVSVTVRDDDTANISVSESSLELPEGGGTGTYTIRLESQPTSDVTITPVSSEPTDATVSGALTFTTANWNQTQTVTVTAIDDSITNRPERVVTISHTVAGGGYESETADPVVVTLLDDENTPPELVIELPDREAVVGLPFSFSFPADIFTDVENDPLTFEAQQGDGSALPSWLSFDANTRTFTGRPGPDSEGTVTIAVIAFDGNTGTSETFDINVAGADSPQAMARDQTVNVALASVATRAVSAATESIGPRFDALPPPNLTVAGQQVAFGHSGPAAVSCSDAEVLLGESWAGSHDCAPAYSSRGITPSELLGSSEFSVTLGASHSDGGPLAQLSMWGRGDSGSFEGHPVGGRYEGETQSLWIGADTRAANWVVGVAASQGTGETDYFLDGGSEGRFETELTALWPYIGLSTDNGLALQGMFGAGRGEISQDLGGGIVDSDKFSLRAGVLGMSWKMSPQRGPTLTVRTDASLGQLVTDGQDASVGVAVDSWRVRAGIEASWRFNLNGGSVLEPYVEGAARRDGGDGLAGNGLEIAGGLRYDSARLQAEARTRVLQAHSERGVRERGASATVRLKPLPGGQGLSLAFGPRWGSDTGGADTLWQDGLPELPGVEQVSIDTQIGYGIGLGQRGLLTPFAQSNGESQRLGLRYRARRLPLGAELDSRKTGYRARFNLLLQF